MRYNMWISRKQYNFLKENAEKNINAECAILEAEEHQMREVARAMKEYSAVLKERDELKLRVIELEHRLVNEGTRVSQFETCQDCGNYCWDMPQWRECNAANNFKYFTRRN